MKVFNNFGLIFFLPALVIYLFMPISPAYALGKKSAICGSWNNYCKGGTTVETYTKRPTGPTAKELKEQWEKQDLEDASLDAYDTGLEFFENAQWGNAIIHFKEALEYNPENYDALDDLNIAKKKLYDAYQQQLKNKALQEAAAERAKKVIKDSSYLVSKEQDDYEKRNKEWLSKQKNLIKQAVDSEKNRDIKMLSAINQNKVPNLPQKTLNDLKPGDVILMKADSSGFSKAIPYGDLLSRWMQNGSVKPEKYDISHSVIYLKTVNGKRLYLDHQLGDILYSNTDGFARIIDEDTFLKRYEKRLSYVARPKALLSGKKLWEAAKGAALKDNTPYGFFGKNKIVCSELDKFAVIQASAKKLSFLNKSRKWLPVSMTPSDFIDPKTKGRYFVISTLKK